MSEKEMAKKRDNKILIIAGVVLLIAIIMIICTTIGAVYGLRKLSAKGMEEIEELQNNLTKETWVAHSEDLASKLYFEFAEDNVKYSSKFLAMGNKQKIAVMDYIVQDGDTIYVNDIFVDVNVDEDTVIFTPSFVDSRECLICEKE